MSIYISNNITINGAELLNVENCPCLHIEEITFE